MNKKNLIYKNIPSERKTNQPAYIFHFTRIKNFIVYNISIGLLPFAPHLILLLHTFVFPQNGTWSLSVSSLGSLSTSLSTFHSCWVATPSAYTFFFLKALSWYRILRWKIYQEILGRVIILIVILVWNFSFSLSFFSFSLSVSPSPIPNYDIINIIFFSEWMLSNEP